jgi:hypothetical protein
MIFNSFVTERVFCFEPLIANGQTPLPASRAAIKAASSGNSITQAMGLHARTD